MTSALSPSVSVFTSAMDWLNGTLLGTLAVTVAIIAVASIGYLMLSGRIDVRRATQVVLGCFIIFGASSIASGIMSGVRGTNTTTAAVSPHPVTPPQALATSPSPPATTTFDPYAGAALPER